MKTSIALCTYNGAAFLGEQLASLAAQTRLPDELIVGDDRSTDQTIEIIEKFAAAAPFPVSLQINERNLGSTKNFEAAILRCRGDVIFLCDQDDVWLPEKIEKIILEFEKSKDVGLVFSDADLVDENLKPLDRRLWDIVFTTQERERAGAGKFLEVLAARNVVTGATMAFRSSFTHLLIPFPGDIPNTIHDAWIALVAAANAEIKFINQPLVKYRQHAGQQLGVGSQTNLQITLKSGDREKVFAKSIEFYQNETERLQRLRQAFETMPQFQTARTNLLPPVIEKINGRIPQISEIIRHYDARKNLPKNKMRRLPAIYRELSTARYHRFSRGLSSAIKDLIAN